MPPEPHGNATLCDGARPFSEDLMRSLNDSLVVGLVLVAVACGGRSVRDLGAAGAAGDPSGDAGRGGSSPSGGSSSSTGGASGTTASGGSAPRGAGLRRQRAALGR